MSDLSENYHLRKCFLKREQVPTQSMVREKMTPALATIYFNSMTPRLKEIVGLEPRLKGGGSYWYQPPEELLQGRAVLKPVRKKVLSKLNHQGIDTVGTTVFQKHRRTMDLEIEQAILDSDNKQRNAVAATIHRLWEDLVAAATKNNTEQLKNDYKQFVYFYKRYMGKLEILFHESAIAEIKNARENSLHEMQIKYATVLKHQAILINDEYDKKLLKEKTRLKDEFIENIEINRTAMAEKIHDLKVDKHMALDKIRQTLHSQNLACKIYVALKEREDCSKETDELKHEHMKKVNLMKNTILMQDFKILLDKEKEKKKQEFRNIWRKKICQVVKAFQMFVLDCLNKFPEQAEFFINMEKLMLIQVNESLEDSTAPSIIELEKEEFHTPIPQVRPFYLFCDKGYKPKVERDLCPKHSGTSTTTDIPVMIINKRCLYAACDNFEQFTNKIKEFIHGHRGDDADFKDDLDYQQLVPVKYGSSQQLLEMKLESSLLQVLQQEIDTHMQTDEKIPIKCNVCELTWCSCRPRPTPTSVDGSEKIKLASPITSSKAPRHKLQTIDRNLELVHERGPKWDSFCWHVEPKKCSCPKTIKKHLAEYLPVYMRHMRFEEPGYEMCSIKELKTLVKEARRKVRETPVPVPVAVLSGTEDMSTQCYEPRFEAICTCYSDDEFSTLINDMKLTAGPKIQLDNMSPSFMTQQVDTFATLRAHSLRNLVENLSELEYIFKKDSCDFK